VFPAALTRRLRTWLSRGRAVVDPNAWFEADAIDEIRDVYYRTAGAAGTAWDRYRSAHMRLPSWFRAGLDPWSAEYAAQQHRLWGLLAGVNRPYAATEDEQDVGWDDADPIRRPGYYQRRDPLAVATAADHWMATGMLMKHSGLAPGDRALEYGPGFGQSALALARLGVEVDTVDISPRFVRYMARQARHFDVPLRSFRGRFGDRPDPARQYQLIWFYESFHHCADFMDVVPKLLPMLAEGGRVILGDRKSVV
jgi:2-polyprenyl-3-methyl-5-hydroxy-6-metoxy-1,4-benzoquinol methylase